MTGHIHLVEVFSSIQGEGKYVGCRQLFVRLAGCNLCCDYCDTPTGLVPAAVCRIEQTPGQRDFVELANPVEPADLAQRLNRLLRQPHHSVSFTGGEPLCQAAALQKVMERTDGKIYLETNGTLPDELNRLLSHIDIISMDIKLPKTTGRALWQEHGCFLALAGNKDVFVKLVIEAGMDIGHFDEAVTLIAGINPETGLFLQPVTPVNGCRAISPAEIIQLQDRALKLLCDVRVIPQTHKFLGQL